MSLRTIFGAAPANAEQTASVMPSTLFAPSQSFHA